MSDTIRAMSKQASAIYARISADEGLELGVTRQVQDARRLAERDDRTIPDDMVLVDNDISASTRSTKVRPAWNRLIEMIEAGRIAHVYAYSNSRLTRRPMELEDLIQLHEKTGVVFHTVASGQDDLSTADGRMVARIKASVDAAEAERIGERVARQKRQRAEMGLPQGGRYPTFGFTREWTVVEDEAVRLREAFRRRASGESITSIAASVGLSHSTLAKILANPVYAGMRSYKGEVVGDLYAEFPRLIERTVWDAVQAVNESTPSGTNTRRHLLSGIARCGACQGRMKGAPSGTRAARYRCASTYGGCGKTSIRTDWVDDPVVFAAVAREVFMRREGENPPPTPDFASEAETIKRDIADVQAAVSARQITMSVALPMLSQLEDRLRAVERDQRQAAVHAVSPNWAYDDAKTLLGLPLGSMRALLARHLVAVEIEPSPTRGRNQLDLGRVVLHWTDGTTERLTNGVPVVDEISISATNGI